MFLEEAHPFSGEVPHISAYFFTEYYPLDVKPRAFRASKECKEKNPSMNENKLF